MTRYPLMIDLAGPALSPDERALLRERRVGGVCYFSRNFRDRVQAAELSAELRELQGEALLIATDQEGGGVVRALDVPYSPGTMLLGAADDCELTRRVAAATARGLRAMGVNVDFAPVADVNNNPRNPVIGDRAFGSEPERVARHVVAFVQGLQAEGVAATVKHFPGHGDTGVDSHLALPHLEVPRARLEAVEFAPFRAAIAAGVACVMSYHGVVPALEPELPATLSRRVMTGVLRDELGFDGVSLTDALEMQAIAQRFGPAEAVVRALAAGVDLPLYDVHTGPVRTHEAILQGIDRALDEGRLEPTEMARKLERLRRLAKRYPATPEPASAWREGDEALLAGAARRAVAVLGDLAPLAPGSSVALVSAAGTVGGAASDRVGTPAEALSGVLEARGLRVRRVFYDREALDGDGGLELMAEASAADATLFVSASRTRMAEAEVRLARAVAAGARRFIHLALWNPYHVQDLPGPALLSFGFRAPSLRAAAEVLLGASATGRLPVALTTADAAGAQGRDG